MPFLLFITPNTPISTPATSPQQDKKPNTSSPDTIQAGAKTPVANS